MEELFADLWAPRLVGHRQGFRPHVDVFRTNDPPTITVVVELAGVEQGDLELAVLEDTLVISGRRRREAVAERVYQHIEIDHGPFERRIRLAEPVDADAAEARLERGLLLIRLPVAGRASGPVKVQITTAARRE